MQTRTRPPDESDVIGDDGVVEREVEIIRTRQHVAGAPVDDIASEAVVSERSVGYFETLPERLTALGLVLRTAIVALLGIRFLLRASGANTSSDFAQFILNVSWIFARPFANVFKNLEVGSGVIEVSTLVAMGVYFFVFALLGMLVAALTPRLKGAGKRSELWATTPEPAQAPVAAPEAPRRRRRSAAATGQVREHRRLFRLRERKTS